MDEAMKVAEMFADTDAVCTAQREVLTDRHSEKDSNLVDALLRMKKTTDAYDTFFLYEISLAAFSTQQRQDYVFKTSHECCEVAIEADIDGPANPLQEENIYVDGKHGRVERFISLAMWIRHQALNKLIRLCSMEVRSESTENLVKFHELFSQACAEVKGVSGYKINPRAFMCDASGAMQRAVEEFYGPNFIRDNRYATCAWHFLQDAKKKSFKLPDANRRLSMDLTANMVGALSTASYNEAYAKIVQMGKTNETLQGWISWWHARRGMTFPAFRGDGFPGSNQAESGNAGWNRRNMRLWQACKDDTSTMMIQSADLKLLRENQTLTLGKGRSTGQRWHAEHRGQLQGVQEYCKLLSSLKYELQAMDGTSFQPHRNARHAPPKSTQRIDDQGHLTGKANKYGKKATVKTLLLGEAVAAVEGMDESDDSLPDLPEDLDEDVATRLAKKKKMANADNPTLRENSVVMVVQDEEASAPGSSQEPTTPGTPAKGRGHGRGRGRGQRHCKTRRGLCIIPERRSAPVFQRSANA